MVAAASKFPLQGPRSAEPDLLGFLKADGTVGSLAWERWRSFVGHRGGISIDRIRILFEYLITNRNLGRWKIIGRDGFG